MKTYKDGTALETIIEDGWAMGFDVSQTIDEAAEMGFIVSRGYVLAAWDVLEQEMVNAMSTV